MAGAAGFEPTNDGIKNRCLTTWRRPKDGDFISTKFALVKRLMRELVLTLLHTSSPLGE